MQYSLSLTVLSYVHVHLHFKLFIIGRIKMDGRMISVELTGTGNCEVRYYIVLTL